MESSWGSTGALKASIINDWHPDEHDLQPKSEVRKLPTPYRTLVLPGSTQPLHGCCESSSRDSRALCESLAREKYMVCYIRMLSFLIVGLCVNIATEFFLARFTNRPLNCISIVVIVIWVIWLESLLRVDVVFSQFVCRRGSVFAVLYALIAKPQAQQVCG